MLMKTQLSAEDLGLEDKFYEGLLKFREMLRNNEFVHWHQSENSSINKVINMAKVIDTVGCKTVGCILGWSRVLAYGFSDSHLILDEFEIIASDHDRNENRTPSLRVNVTDRQCKAFDELVMPANYLLGKHSLEEITYAIDTYLMTGWPEWPPK